MFVFHKVILFHKHIRGFWDCFCWEVVKGWLVESIEMLWMLGTKPATRCFPTDFVLIGSTRPSLADISVDLLAYFILNLACKISHDMHQALMFSCAGSWSQQALSLMCNHSMWMRQYWTVKTIMNLFSLTCNYPASSFEDGWDVIIFVSVP
jgi:hypothetical protein